MRGFPGSGKSDLVKDLIRGREAAIHSTDDYHLVDGKYIFNKDKIVDYHRQNLEAFQASCKEGIEVVVCDNTNIIKKHYKPYVKAAKKYGYKVVVVIAGEFDPHICHERCKHGLSLSHIKDYKGQFEL